MREKGRIKEGASRREREIEREEQPNVFSVWSPRKIRHRKREGVGMGKRERPIVKKAIVTVIEKKTNKVNTH